MISAVDLIKGIGRIIGMRVIEVEGATGYYDTNYLGKAKAALEVLKEVDFVFIHIEATDEAGHNQDLRMKITCIERIDNFILGTIVKEMEGMDFRILVVPDHPTPISKRTHTDEPVPFLISGNNLRAEGPERFSENSAAESKLFFDSGRDLIDYFLRR